MTATGEQSGLSIYQWFYQSWPNAWLNTSGGYGGNWVEVCYNNFRSNETVNVTYNGVYVGSGSSDWNGYGCMGFQVPSGPQGYFPVVVTGERSGLSVVLWFTQYG